MKIDTPGMERILAQLREAATVAAGAAQRRTAPAGTPSFADVLAAALDKVDLHQARAERLAAQYTTGEEGVELQEVMLALSKAHVSFQAAVQVRNRLVAAYHEIMNMQV